jgi:hypothetical protein
MKKYVISIDGGKRFSDSILIQIKIIGYLKVEGNFLKLTNGIHVQVPYAKFICNEETEGLLF